MVVSRSFADFTPQATFDIKVRKTKDKDGKPDGSLLTTFSCPVEMRAAPPGGGSSGEGGADPGAGPAVLPPHADGAPHGAEG